MQTATEYIFEQLEEQGLIFLTTKTNEMTISISASDYLDIKRLAKEMEKKQCGRSFNSGYNRCEWDNSVGSCYDEEPKEFEQYYNETYGSKGSNETNGNNVEKVPNVTSSQTEISDEEIAKFAEEFKDSSRLKSQVACFSAGMKAYREQLKQRQ